MMSPSKPHPPDAAPLVPPATSADITADPMSPQSSTPKSPSAVATPICNDTAPTAITTDTAVATTAVSSTDHPSEPPPPPQPPLSSADPPFTLPQIVHGIDPDDPAEPSPLPPSHPLPTAARPATISTAMSDVFTSISAGVQRAVRLAAPTTPSAKVIVPTVLLFGDSLTMLSDRVSTPSAPGWGSLLREAYGARATVAISGFSGYNSKWALHLLPRCMRALRTVRVVILFWGANDATEKSCAQHVALAEYARNLTAMIRFVRASGATPVLITPPALGSHNGPGGRTSTNTMQYAVMCGKTGVELGVPVVDFCAAMTALTATDPGALDRLLDDGLHLSAAGNRLLYELVLELFAEALPDLMPAVLPEPALPWREIDYANPAKSLGPCEILS